MGTSESVRSAHGVDSAGLVLDREVSGVLEGWVGREQVVFFLFLLFTCRCFARAFALCDCACAARAVR